MTQQDRDREERELRARLEKLSGKLGEARQNAAEEKARETATSGQGREAGRMMSLAFRMVSDLVAGILVGLAIGWALDRAFSSSPLFLIVFSLLGAAAGFWNIIRAASPSKVRGKDEPGN